VQFTDTSTGAVTSWSWDFGDGGGSAAQNPSHTYNSPGTYIVRLTITGPGGSSTKTAAIILATNPAKLLNEDRFSFGDTGDTAAWAVAAAGNTAFVAGSGYDDSGKSLWLVKAYNAATGLPKWPEADAFDLGDGLNSAQAVAASGSTAYVAGWGYQSGAPYLVVRAYSSKSPAAKWTAQFPLGQVDQYPVGIAAKGGTVLVFANGFASGHEYGVIYRLDAGTGAVKWAKNFTAGSGASQARALALSGSAAAVAGWEQDGGKTWWLVQGLDIKTGACKWAADKFDGGDGVNHADALAAAGSTFVAAGSASVSGQDKAMVRSYDAKTGAPKWTRPLDLAGGGHLALSAAASGNYIYVTAYAQEWGQRLGFVSALDGTSGAPCWADEIGLAGDVTPPQTLAARKSRVYLAGSAQDQGGYYDWLVQSYDTAGSRLWSDQFTPGAADSSAMAVAAANKAVIAGGWARNAAGRKEWLVRFYAP
jgi:PKD repeat protein